MKVAGIRMGGMISPIRRLPRIGLIATIAVLLQACSTTQSDRAQDALDEPTSDQDSAVEIAATDDVPPEPSHAHLPIGWSDSGLSFGNSRRWKGVRINFRDHGVEEVKGLNVTLWSTRSPSLERMNGLALGVQTGAVHGRGLSLGLLAAVGEESLRGVQLGGLATVSDGTLTGVSAAGLAVAADGEMRGVSIAGLAVVSEGGMRGISVAGLAIASKGPQRGINVAGLAVVSEGSRKGICVAGLASVTEGDMHGLSLAGLVTVAEGEIHGVGISGLATVFEDEFRGVGVAGLIVGDSRSSSWPFVLDQAPNSEHDTSATGLMLAGYRVQANRLSGVAAALIMTRSHEMTGLAIGAYNNVSGRQEGLAVGLFNHATELRGIQIGLLNHVAENPKWLRWLPIVNARF